MIICRCGILVLGVFSFLVDFSHALPHEWTLFGAQDNRNVGHLNLPLVKLPRRPGEKNVKSDESPDLLAELALSTPNEHSKRDLPWTLDEDGYPDTAKDLRVSWEEWVGDSPRRAREEHHEKRDALKTSSSSSSSPSTTKLLKRGSRWTAAEELLLIKLRDEENMPWSEVAAQFPGRTYRALSLKYYILKGPPSKTRGRYRDWTDEEEELLMKLASMDMSWKERAEKFSGRSDAALRVHYNKLMLGEAVPSTVQDLYTDEEDQRLLRLREEDLTWEEVTRQFEGRSVNSVKKRYRMIADKSKHPRWTPGEEEQLLEALEVGMTRKEIAEHFERTVRAVSNRARQLRFVSRRKSTGPKARQEPIYTDKELRLMRKLREEGVTWLEISKEHLPERSGLSLILRYRRYLEESKGEGDET